MIRYYLLHYVNFVYVHTCIYTYKLLFNFVHKVKVEQAQWRRKCNLFDSK